MGFFDLGEIRSCVPHPDIFKINLKRRVDIGSPFNVVFVSNGDNEGVFEMMDVSGNSGIEMNFECHLNVYDHDKRFMNEYQVPDGYELLEQEDGKEPVWYNPENARESVTRAHIYPLLQDTFEKSGPYTLHMLAVRNIQDF